MISRDFWILNVFIICLASITPVFSVAEVDLFPHKESEGSTVFRFGDDGLTQAPFTSPFTFLNKTYHAVVISGNGALGFGPNGIPRISASETCHIVGIKNYQVIMGYWDDAYESLGATLTYMETSEPTHLHKARSDINTAFPQFDTGSESDLSWMFIVTWKNIGPCCENVTSLQNTFQLILTKSESHSFVLFYYTKIQWYRGRDWAAGFDIGTLPPIHLLPGSCTSKFENLTYSSNIGEDGSHKGKWVFGVESNLILPGMELPKEPVAKPEQVLLTQPSVISVVGNVPILLRGSMWEKDAITNISITCVFRDPSRTRPSETVGIILANSVICPVPFLYSLGRMEINVLVKYPSQSNLNLYRGHIYVVREHEVDHLPRIIIETSTEHIPTLSATWLVSSTKVNFLKDVDRQGGSPTLPKSASSPDSIEIVLLEFKRNTWKELGSVTPSIPNNGSYTSHLNISVINELTKSSVGESTLHMFALKANYILESGSTIHKLLPSLTPIPTEMIIFGNSSNSEGNIYDGFCKSWYNKETCPSTNPDTFPCPKTQDQAQNDWRFSPASTLLHPPAVVSSFLQKVPSLTGAASQCNYDNRGNLLIGIPGAGHLFRHSPNNRKDYWKHYLEDIMPYMYCCQWGEFKEANCPSYYYQKRPSDNGRNYSFPRPSRTTGLSHMTTFDGRNFTLVGAGEIWMIKYSSRDRSDGNNSNFTNSENCYQANGFRMQARIEPYHSPGFDDASIVTAAVMEDISNDKQVKVQVSYVPNPSHILVMVDDQLINATGRYNFNHESVTIRFRYGTEMVASFSTGFSVLFLTSSRNESSLNIVVTADSHLINRTKGILGNTDEASDIVLKWMVREAESLFSYPIGKSYADYNNKPGFMPRTIFMNGSSPVQWGDQEFAHDMSLTQSESLVVSGMNAYNAYSRILDTSNLVVNQCELPDDLENGRYLVNSLGVGSNITVSCDPGYTSYPESANESFACEIINVDDVTDPTSSSPTGKIVEWMNTDTNEEMPSFSCSEVVNEDEEMIDYESSTSTEDTMTEDIVGGIGLGEESEFESNPSCLILYDSAFLLVVIGVAIVVAVILITICVTLVYLYVRKPSQHGFVNGISISPSRDRIVEESEF